MKVSGNASREDLHAMAALSGHVQKTAEGWICPCGYETHMESSGVWDCLCGRRWGSITGGEEPLRPILGWNLLRPARQSRRDRK